MGKAEKTRQFIIERTAPVFNTKGYAGTTLSDLIEATGLTKGSIYGNFRDKDEVVVEVYKYNVDKLHVALRGDIATKYTPLEQLFAFVDFYRSSFPRILQEGGCPMINASTASHDKLDFLQEIVKNSFEGWLEMLSNIFQDGVDDGSFNKIIQPTFYASLFMMLIEGAVLLTGALNDENQLTIALAHITQIIENEIKK